jgi:hypothetical protein
MRRLQDILNDLPFEILPPSWTTFDLAAFGVNKRLFDYQQEALKSAIKALWKYYEDFGDWQPTEPPEVNGQRKSRFYQWYLDNGLNTNIDIDVAGINKRDIRALLMEHYPVENGRLAFQHLVNRLGFWMATGSGKTLVLIKLLELIGILIRRGEIPPYDILVLTHRDDLLTQIKTHIVEFNAGQRDLFIQVYDLREYPDVKRSGSLLCNDQDLTVFVYRSDNLSNEQKEKIIDFRNYDNRGCWYILLDEAHKGDKEDSKRQHIYSILSRNGFLFNFSATFTDERDILTTAYDFNLARFVQAGYGKHISILKQETRAFRDDEDYTGAEKQKLVLKTLLILTYIRRVYDSLKGARGEESIYHQPLMLTLVNSVNTEDADLKLFFRELERIGKGEVGEAVFEQAKAELRSEFDSGVEWMFEGRHFTLKKDLFDLLNYPDVLAAVYNAPSPAGIEVLIRPSDRQEIALKLKSADQPFALIKIGDISGWLKKELAGYEIVEGFEDEGFFDRLNTDDSDINILMGSRSFYEGWDSNRPNVITFINIGTGTEARKFILQSVGRGVRIEPFANKRKRLQQLYNAREVPGELFQELKELVQPLETLFILGTNRQALQTVIEQIELEKGEEIKHEVSLDVDTDTVNDHVLLVPVYRPAEQPLVEQRKPRKFSIAVGELELLQRYLYYLNDDRLLLAHHQVTPRQVKLIRRTVNSPTDYFDTSTGKLYGDVRLALQNLFAYFALVPQEIDRLKPLEEEIRHFRHIKVLLEDIRELQEKIKRVREAPTRIAELRAKYEAQQLNFEEFLREAQSIRDTETFSANGSVLSIKRIAHHYYTPVLLSNDAKIDYIRHIIRHDSEVRFLNQLEDYLKQEKPEFTTFDWWLFSKLDEVLDDVYIPYYDPGANNMRRFIPDFVFWLQRGSDYLILFVDPKGTAHTSFEYKVDGYRALFEDEHGEPRIFSYNGWRVRILLAFYTDDVNRLSHGYRKYWCDHPASIARRCVESIAVDFTS